MAYDFDGNDDALNVLVSTYSSIPAGGFSMGIWFNTDAVDEGVLWAMQRQNQHTSTGWLLKLSSTGVLQAVSSANSDNAGIATAGTITTGVWMHAGLHISSDSGNPITAYIDGVAGTTDTTGANPGSVARERYGSTADQSPSNFFNGRLAESFVAAGALTDRQWAALALGYSPLLVIPPSKLRSYKKLIGRGSTAPDVVYQVQGTEEQRVATLVGAPAYAPHPRIIYRRSDHLTGGIVQVGGPTPEKGEVTRLALHGTPMQLYGTFDPKAEFVITKSGTVTRLALWGGPMQNYGDFDPKTEDVGGGPSAGPPRYAGFHRDLGRFMNP